MRHSQITWYRFDILRHLWTLWFISILYYSIQSNSKTKVINYSQLDISYSTHLSTCVLQCCKYDTMRIWYNNSRTYFIISAWQATRILQVILNNLEFSSGQTRSHTYVTLLHSLSSLAPGKLKLNISTYRTFYCSQAAWHSKYRDAK